ncbi:dienelactone hydrolase family protein [Niveibacterium terrae]|uniref:dienelactone hydrolase family protein n=1 Tax=Niveibacterium terrae TaxID=3373598 RepID=UPI003A8F25F6
MKTIIACDIHGIHAELRALCAPLGEALTFLSPWEGEGCPFASEALAHQALIAERGIETYADRIAECAAGEPVFLIAFSVGATAAWLHACSGEAHPESAAVLFYGSRIREHAQRVPKFPVEAIFAEREASFEPAALVAALKRERVRCAIVPGTAHGFMNPCSVNFVPDLADRWVGEIGKRLDAWSAHQGL